MKNYQTLEVWTSSIKMIKMIYKETTKFPKEELYGLTSQIRRAAVSVAANFAEAHGRQYKKDSIHFLHISRGSICELEALLSVALEVEMISTEDFAQISEVVEKTSRLLNGYINYMRNSTLR